MHRLVKGNILWIEISYRKDTLKSKPHMKEEEGEFFMLQQLSSQPSSLKIRNLATVIYDTA